MQKSLHDSIAQFDWVFYYKSVEPLDGRKMLTIQQVRSLLDIQTRDTMNEDLKALGLFGCASLTWSQVRTLLEMRLFLGLKPGIHSREQFKQISKEQLLDLFGRHHCNVEQQFQDLQSKHQTKHRVTVQLVLDRD